MHHNERCKNLYCRYFLSFFACFLSKPEQHHKKTVSSIVAHSAEVKSAFGRHFFILYGQCCSFTISSPLKIIPLKLERLVNFLQKITNSQKRYLDERVAASQPSFLPSLKPTKKIQQNVKKPDLQKIFKTESPAKKI